MIKAIIVDLDDTLLRYDKTISELTKNTLEKCRSKGIKVIFATARGASSKKIISQESFDGCIMYNGALAEINNQIIHERFINPQIFCPFLKKIDELGMNAAAEINGIHHANFEVSLMWERDFILTKFENIKEESEKLYVIINSERDIYYINKYLPPELYVHYTKDNLALIMDKEATKLNALSSVLEWLNIPICDVIAFGDDINDKEMLEKCGIGIAMNNALREIKEVADEICDSCDNDGVARWLLSNILSE